jgi:mannose-6-phosphate isomerase-like protein (cupin superfamily)
MRRSKALVLCVIGGITGSAAGLLGQDGASKPAEGTGPVVPVHHEPHHRQVFQYGPMRILDLQLPPGDISWFHTHEWPVFYLTTSDSQTVSQNLGEEWGAGRAGRGGARGAAPAPPVAAPATTAPATPAPPRAANAAPPGGRGFRPRLMSDLSYAERAVTHRIRNDGTGLFRAMVVVNETPGNDTVTEQAAGFQDKPISTNKWFRAYRIVLGPGEKTPAHQHKAPVVVLQDTAGKGVGAGAMKFELNEPGQWAFFDAGDRHEVTNTGTDRLELIEVEVRRP